jgi:hypothetical protein
MMTYYDRRSGRNRYKKRYVWAAWAFCVGLAFGLTVSLLF